MTNSYKERFRKTKVELEEVVEEKQRLEEDRDTLRRAQVYTEILAGKPPAAYTPFDSPKSLNRAKWSVVGAAASTFTVGPHGGWGG